MAEVNFAKVFGTLAKNLCESCEMPNAQWVGNEDGGQNLCEPCATLEEYGEPVYTCSRCGHAAWAEKGYCVNPNC